MLKPLTKKQEKLLLNDLKAKKEDDEYIMTIDDKITEKLLLECKGIYKNGKTVEELGSALGYDMNDTNQKINFRSMLCNTVKLKLEMGFPFGGVKLKKQKKIYGVATKEEETNKIIFDKKYRFRNQLNSAKQFFTEEDELYIKDQVDKVYIEVSKQLSLPFYE
jgi:hypothetical protein